MSQLKLAIFIIVDIDERNIKMILPYIASMFYVVTVLIMLYYRKTIITLDSFDVR